MQVAMAHGRHKTLRHTFPSDAITPHTSKIDTTRALRKEFIAHANVHFSQYPLSMKTQLHGCFEPIQKPQFPKATPNNLAAHNKSLDCPGMQ
jgi:hypothetical protein